MELAVLDLGSTTFHLQHFVVGAGTDGGDLVSSLDSKRCTCLGAQVFADGYIDERSRAEALAAVDELLKQSDGRGFTDRVVVATSAIRTARNGAELAQQIQSLHGCAVRILEPDEEAWLAYAGQLGSAAVTKRRFAMVDLGGGSVEMSVGQGDQRLYANSLPLGAVRVRAGLKVSSLDRSEYATLSATLREHLRQPLLDVHTLEPELYVFGSGSARAARKLLMRASTHPGKTGPLVTASFRRELEALLGRAPAQLIELGVEPARATTVLTAATIMLQILDLLGVSEAYVSDRGLRDGVAREMLRSAAPVSSVYRRDFLSDGARTARRDGAAVR